MAKIVAVLFFLSGLALTALGIWLISVGGAYLYVIFGLAFLATGVLTFYRHPLALWVHALTLIAMMIWAVYEVGFDWWQLAPRGDVAVILGVLLVLPWTVRRLEAKPLRSSGWWALATSLVLSGIVAVGAMATPAHDQPGLLSPAAQQAAVEDDNVPPGEWQAYGRTDYGQRYAPLDQITPANVGTLETAWTFRTGQVRSAGDPVETTYEVTPLMVDNTVYLCTPWGFVFALDAETGKERWRFDSNLNKPPREVTQHLTCRGLAFSDLSGRTPPVGAPPLAADCQKRLFLPTADARLVAISSTTGKVCSGFGGASGAVDLWQHMPNVRAGSYYSTSPPVTTDRMIIVGGAVNDNVSVSETAGVIRAFDLYTGELVWNWDSGRPDTTAPLPQGATYTNNSPNAWAPLSYDPKLRLVFAPIGNQPPDQWGGKRSEAVERYSSSVVALNADTGAVVWDFQSVHHDIWDYDVPAQPSLVDLTIDGRTVPALVQPTKQGEVFVLDRRTGRPALPVDEVAAPQGAAQGDRASRTQPLSRVSFRPADLTPQSMWGATIFDQAYCRILFHRLRYEGRFTPPSTQGTIVHPGNFGVFNWGGVAVDPVRQVMFAMPVAFPFVSKLIQRKDATTRLVTKPDEPPFNENFGAPFAAQMGPFLGLLGIPCNAPPWGTVAGVDLTTGRVAWRHVNGTVRDLSPIPLPFEMGVPGIGGPIVTAGGVAFLSGTLDYYVRAYDLLSGRKLWQDRLPAGAQATPMTYLARNGRQYLVVVAGGHGSTGTKAGDYVIAYALPRAR